MVFKYDNVNEHSLLITTNPPINKPVYLEKNTNPKEISIGKNKIVYTNKDKYTSIMLLSTNLNQKTSDEKVSILKFSINIVYVVC